MDIKEAEDIVDRIMLDYNPRCMPDDVEWYRVYHRFGWMQYFKNTYNVVQLLSRQYDLAGRYLMELGMFDALDDGLTTIAKAERHYESTINNR